MSAAKHTQTYRYRVSWATVLYLIALAAIFIAWALSLLGLIHIARRIPDVR